MKPIPPKYNNLVKVEFMISDRSAEIIKQYAAYTNYPESEIVDKMISEIVFDDPKFVSHILSMRYGKKIKGKIFPDSDVSNPPSKEAQRYGETN